ncbi:DUF5050 domain-containing protein [uncultured Mitsuokella sp.]|uniref:DUF5050 domain-containing protein n=1 Tax=uncultured Mitsuokella sp. TaxID=453120 RepID=UPI0026173E7E|nr:DUF5050 domain-containing protein [uncultured Mitsuokella sp.]
MNKKEYLVSLRNRTEAGTSEQDRKRLYKGGALLLVAALAAIAAGMGISYAQRSNAYEVYQQSGEIPYEYLDVKGVFASWNEQAIGNDANALLTGGKVLVRNHLRITGAASVPPDSGFRQLPAASYLNLVGNTIVYRSDKDRHIYAADRDSLESRVLYDGNAGEVFCTGSRVYFIDYDAGGIVSCLELFTPSDKKVVTQESVRAFAVCGDEILYLSAAHTLCRAPLPQGEGVKIHPHQLMHRVERFYLYDEGIVAESRDAVSSFTMQGDCVRLRYRSQDKDLQVLGCLAGRLVLRENGSYKFVRLDTMQTEPMAFESADSQLLTSLMQDETGALLGVVYDEQDAAAADRLVCSGTIETAGEEGK